MLPPLFGWIRDLRSGIRDLGSGMGKNLDPGLTSWIRNTAYGSGSATLLHRRLKYQL